MSSPINYLSFLWPVFFLTGCVTTEKPTISSTTGEAEVGSSEEIVKAYSGEVRNLSDVVMLETIDRVISVRQIGGQKKLFEGSLGYRFHILPGHHRLKVMFSKREGSTSTTSNDMDLDFTAERGKKYRVSYRIIGEKFIPWVERIESGGDPVIVSSNISRMDKKFEGVTGKKGYFSSKLNDRNPIVTKWEDLETPPKSITVNKPFVAIVKEEEKKYVYQIAIRPGVYKLAGKSKSGRHYYYESPHPVLVIYSQKKNNIRKTQTGKGGLELDFDSIQRMGNRISYTSLYGPNIDEPKYKSYSEFNGKRYLRANSGHITLAQVGRFGREPYLDKRSLDLTYHH